MVSRVRARGKGRRAKGENAFLDHSPWPIAHILIISTAVAAIFIAFPQIDLFVSGLFYVPGKKFFLSENIVLVAIRHVVEITAAGLGILWVVVLVAGFVKKKDIWGLSRIRVIYLLLALAVGPGLVVNAVFKDMWGRARPSQIEMFGGKKQFTPAFIISDQCNVNCSFVSGDPSIGFYFFALALAIPKKRKLFTGVALGLGGIFGATRILQGGHFLSDVIFSGVFTFLASYLLYIAMQKLERSLQK